MDKTFYMLVGLPGSGKSTLAQERFAGKDNIEIISSDAFIEDIAAKNGISYEEAYKSHIDLANSRCMTAARAALSAGKDVVWDQVNINLEDRTRKLALVPDDYFKVAIYFELETEELVDRYVGRHKTDGKSVPVEEMVRLSESYERPGRYEGFDYILPAEAAF